MLNQICECLTKCIGISNDRQDKSKEVSSLNLTTDKAHQGVSLDESTVKKIMNPKLINNILDNNGMIMKVGVAKCVSDNNEMRIKVGEMNCFSEIGNSDIKRSRATVKDVLLQTKVGKIVQEKTVIIQQVPLDEMPHKVIDCTQVENSFMNHSWKISNVGVSDMNCNLVDQTHGDIIGILGNMETEMTVSKMIYYSRDNFISMTYDNMNDLFEYMYFTSDFYRVNKYPVYINESNAFEDIELSSSENYSDIFFNKELIKLFNSNSEFFDIEFHFMVFSGDLVYYQSSNSVISYHHIFAIIDSKMKLFDSKTKIKIDIAIQETMDSFGYSDVSDVQRVAYIFSILSDSNNKLTIMESIDNASGKINGLYIICCNRYSENLYIFHDPLIDNLEKVRDLFVDKSLFIKYVIFGRSLFVMICKVYKDVNICNMINIDEFNYMFCLHQRPNLIQINALIGGVVNEFFSENSYTKGIFALRAINGKNSVEVGSLMFTKVPITNRKNKDCCFIIDFRNAN